MKRRITIILIITLLTIGISASLFYYFNHVNFSGNCESSRTSYKLDIEYMNGTDSHELELKKDGTLEIRFKTEQGSIRLKINAPDGSEIYSGSGKDITVFDLSIRQDGIYTVLVKAEHAKGAIHIVYKEPITE